MQAENRIGYQTIEYKTKPWIMASACAVGPREGQGPLGDCFDLVAQDAAFGQDSYEQAEAALLREACRLCLAKANIGEKVTVMGWVQKSRNKGGIIFVDLRDRSGIPPPVLSLFVPET